MIKNGDMFDVSDIIEIFLIKLLGVVFDDKNIIVLINKGEFIVLDDNVIFG